MFDHAVNAVNSRYFHVALTQFDQPFNALDDKAIGEPAFVAVLQGSDGENFVARHECRVSTSKVYGKTLWWLGRAHGLFDDVGLLSFEAFARKGSIACKK